MSAPGKAQNPFQDHLKAIENTFTQTKAAYGKLQKADKMLGKVRGQLDNLAQLGDMVTQEDVVKSASTLVAHGLEPLGMAGLLADMPPDGQALQAWVGKHLEGLQQREDQLAQVMGPMRHQLGQSAFHLLTAHHVGLAQGGVPEAPAQSQTTTSAPVNELAPGGPGNA